MQEARRKIPSLIILDLMLPGVDGFDVCKSLKNDPRTKAVPIVMLTARSEEADIVIGLELGADDYLTKPFSPRELIARVRAILRRSKADISDQEILQSAIDVCIVDAEDKNIEVQLTCPKDFFVYVNGPLLEQAIINLVMNSIKYSDEESKVLVDAGLENGGTVISVKDFGVGIAAEHLPRLFERFYRSDKARSRKLGGTGLGLSIVKHIVQVHEGNVTVDSTPGKGAIFSIHLPGSQVN